MSLDLDDHRKLLSLVFERLQQHGLVINDVSRDVAAAPQTPNWGGPGQLWGPKLVSNCFLAT